jgi:uncharacterized membrane protein (UPF0127 family)
MRGSCRFLRLLALGLVLCVYGASCGEKPVPARSSSVAEIVPLSSPARSPRSLKRGTVVIYSEGQPPWRVIVEVARTAAQRAKGLMHRKELLDDHGMLFIFQSFERHHFFMKNTYIPLDIIFFSGDRGSVSVVGVLENMRPFDERPKSVEARSYAALEVRSPWVKRRGIKPGDRVVLEITGASR